MRYKLVYVMNLTTCICLLYLSAFLSQCSSQRNRNRKKGQIPCSRFEFTGYSCVSRDSCGNDGYTIDDAVDQTEIRTNIGKLRNNFNLDFVSAKYSCPSKNTDICCRKSSFYGLPEPVIKDVIEYQQFCDQYSSYGYRCVTEDQCGTDGYTVDGSISGGISIRELSINENSFVSKLSCDVVSSAGRVSSSLLTCCRNSSFFGIDEPPEVDISSDECTKWKGDGFKCVDAEACEDGYFDNSGGVPAIRGESDDYIDIDKPLLATCSKTGFVCCRNDRFFNKPLINKAPKLEVDPVEKPKIPFKPECGRRNDLKGLNEASEYRIQATWPHMCTIWNATSTRDSIKKEYVCGASLISPNMVLTTAHNIENIPLDNLVVRCGEGDTIVDGQHQDRWALEKTNHENHKMSSQSIPLFDMAVIKVEQKFKLDVNVDTVCLPKSHDDYDPNDCHATGFGQDVYDPTCRRCKKRLLKKIPMSVIDHRVCRNRLRKATRPGKTTPVLGSRFKLHKSFTCAGGNLNHDTCTGDGGSPLVCAKKGTNGKDKKYVQVGIVSWGIGCSNGNPGVYTNVIAGLEFIENQITIR